MNKGNVNFLLLGLLVVVSLGFAYYYGTQNKETPMENLQPILTPTESPTAIPSLTPTTSPTTVVPSGWSTFTSDKYGFSISFPASYKALTDKENLYGWPKGVVLIYNGGQSYDLVIEHWSTLAEFEKVYKNETRVVVEKIGENYISLFNMNKIPEVDKIIETFREN